MSGTTSAPRARRRRSSTILGLAATLVWVAGCSASGPGAAVPTDEPLAIAAPTRVIAGEPFEIIVSSVADGDAVEIVLDGSYGPRRVEAVGQDGLAAVTVPPNPTAEAGIVLVSARTADRVAITTMEVLPGQARDPVESFLGPRTVVADGDDASMIVAVPTDRFGNPVSQGTTVDYLITRPSQTTDRRVAPVDGLLSYVWIESGTVAGRTRVSVTVDGASGQERTLLEVAGRPESLELELADPVPSADGATLVELRTGVIRDRFGNVLPDGTSAVLEATGSTRTRRSTSETIDGVVRFVVEVPRRPGPATFTAFASGAASAPITIDFPAAVEEVPVRVTSVADGRQVLIGPVLTVGGSYVPDGTLASVSADGGIVEIALENGVGSVFVAEGTSRIEVTVLGISSEGVDR